MHNEHWKLHFVSYDNPGVPIDTSTTAAGRKCAMVYDNKNNWCTHAGSATGATAKKAGEDYVVQVGVKSYDILNKNQSESYLYYSLVFSVCAVSIACFPPRVLLRQVQRVTTTKLSLK